MPNPNLTMPGKPGLLTNATEHTAHSSARHLYHATKPPTVPLSEDQEKALKADGYQDEYIPQAYPKLLTIPTGEKVQHITVKDADEERRVLARYSPVRDEQEGAE